MNLSMILQVLKSRTVWMGIVVAVLSVLQGFVLQLSISPAKQAVVGCVLAVMIVLLRAMTDKPLVK